MRPSTLGLAAAKRDLDQMIDARRLVVRLRVGRLYGVVPAEPPATWYPREYVVLLEF